MKNERILFFNLIAKQKNLMYIKELNLIKQFIFPLYKKDINRITIKNIYNNPYNSNFKYLYSKITELHKLLYKYDLFIEIYPNGNQFMLSNIFYLDLLINDYRFSITNYLYELNYIKYLYEYYKNNHKSNTIKKVISFKIINDLIHNYIGSDFFNEEEDSNQLTEIENDIKNSKVNIEISFLGEINFDKKIDEIYADIIVSLIINKKFDDFYYIYNIIMQLELEKIDITKFIFEKILELLDNNQDINKYYRILKLEDLFNKEQKFDFYPIKIYIKKSYFYI